MATPLPPGALSPNFALAEFTTSRIAAVRGISNQPPPELLPNLQVLARALEEVRALLESVQERAPELVKAIYPEPLSLDPPHFTAAFLPAHWGVHCRGQRHP